MALSPEEAWDPERFVDEAFDFESRADRFLREMFQGQPELVFSPGARAYLHDKATHLYWSEPAINAVLERFREAGWTVVWDKDVRHPVVRFRQEKKPGFWDWWKQGKK